MDNNDYQGHLGDLLVEAEQGVLKAVLAPLFGLHLVWIGYNALLPALEASLVQHKLVLGDLVNPHLKATKLVTHPECLGLQPDSVDVVILAHALEVSKMPHQVLREAYRILRPEGQLILTGFNPISALGALNFFRVSKHKKKFFTAARIIDWCQLFDLELNNKAYFFYRPPFQHEKLMQKMQKLENNMPEFLAGLGSGYCLHFTKRVVKLTPIRPNFRLAQKEIWGAETVQNNIINKKI